MEKGRIEQFYDQNGGEKLIDTTCFVPEIEKYLEEEERFLLKILRESDYSGMLEVGCMNGRNLGVAEKLGIDYIGIDIVQRFIDEATRKMTNLDINATAARCDVKFLHEIGEMLSPEFLAVFPFNSFGNIDNPEQALGSVSEQGLDSLILTYGTNYETTKIRREYLSGSQSGELYINISSRGVAFTSRDGLCSYAYSSNAIWNMGKKAGYNNINKKKFSKIGRAFYLRRKR